MANNVVEIIFKGNDEVTSTLNEISSNVDSFSNDLGSIADPIANVTEMVVKLETALAAMAVGGLTYATVEAGKFSSSMNEINTLLDISSDDFNGLSDDVLNYSKSSTASLEDIQNSMYNLISLGVDYKDSIETLNTIEKLSVATKSSLNDTTNTLIGTMNAYGAGIDEASDYSDIFFTIIKDGKTTLPELSTSIANVTSIAATADIPFETLGASIAALTASGATTSAAITQIKAAIQAIIKPTEEASKLAQEFGVDMSASAIESKGFEVVLKEIYDATNGNIEVISKMIPSVEGLNAVTVLGADSSGIFAKTLTDMGNNAGATTEAFDKMSQNLDLLWTELVNNFNAIFIELGLSFEDEIADLLQSFSNFFGSISDEFDKGTFDEIENFIKETINNITDFMNGSAEDISAALNDVEFSEFVDSIDGVLSSLGGLFEDMDLTTPEGLAKAFQRIIDSITSLQTVIKDIIDYIKPLIDAGVSLIDIFNNLDTDTQALIGTVLAFGTALSGIAVTVGVGGVLLSGLSTLSGMFGGLITILSGPVGLTIAVGALAVGFITLLENIGLWSSGDLEASEAALRNYENQNIKLGELLDKIGELPESVSVSAVFDLINEGKLDEANEIVDQLTAEQKEIALKAELDQAEVYEFTENWDEISNNPNTSLALQAAIEEGDIEKIESILSGDYEVGVDVDTTNIEKTKKEIEDIPTDKKLDVKVEDQKIKDIKKEIKEIPSEKLLEISLQGDIDIKLESIKASSEIMQTQFEWQAKLDIEEIQSQTEIVSTMFETLGESISAVTSTTSSMFDSLINGMSDLSLSEQWEFMDIFEQQQQDQTNLINAQIDLMQKQSDYYNEKTDSLNSGDSIITIDSSGLEPALEMIMWEILEKVQVKANESGSEMLLGI